MLNHHAIFIRNPIKCIHQIDYRQNAIITHFIRTEKKVAKWIASPIKKPWAFNEQNAYSDKRILDRNKSSEQTKQKRNDSKEQKKLTMKNKPPLRFVNDDAPAWGKCMSVYLGWKLQPSHFCTHTYTRAHTYTDTTNVPFVFPTHHFHHPPFFYRLCSNHSSRPICRENILFDVYHYTAFFVGPT